VPEQSKEPVRQSYAMVVALLDKLVSAEDSISGVTAAEKRAALLGDTTRCGLVKAVHRQSGHVEWVAPKQKAAFETHGAKVFAKRAKRTAKAEQSGRSSMEERSPSKAASSGSAASPTRGSGGGGMLDKVEQIKAALGITATTPKDAVTQANEQVGLTAQGPLHAQVDALMKELGLEDAGAQRMAAKQASPCPCL